MKWILIFWITQPYVMMEQKVVAGLSNVGGYATSEDCVKAGNSLPQKQFEFFCIPGPTANLTLFNVPKDAPK